MRRLGFLFHKSAWVVSRKEARKDAYPLELTTQRRQDPWKSRRHRTTKELMCKAPSSAE